MAFKRREAAVVEAADLSTLPPEEVERRIISGVKKYSTNEANWSKADSNTPFVGSIVGMGIESSNLADVTMSIERQFLTKKTKRVPLAEGSSEFRLEDGELGKLRILDGQDATAATAGLAVKMLMDLGHMPKRDDYLSKVASYAYIVTLGDGYRLNDSLKRAAEKVGRLSGPEREEAQKNLETLAGKAREYIALVKDPAALAASRKKTFESDRQIVESIKQELSLTTAKLQGATSSGDSTQINAMRSAEASLRSRLKTAQAKLKVSQEVAAESGRQKAVEAAKIAEVCGLLLETLDKSGVAVG